MLLYDSRISGNCYKVRLLLAHLRLDYRRVEVDVIDRSGREQLLGGLNPALRVPVLELDDGRSLAESNAILAYLAEGSRFLPDDRFSRARVLQWLFFEQYSHEPNVAVVMFWLNYAPSPPAQSDVDARRAAGHRALTAMDRHLTGAHYLVDERCTVADLSLYAYTHRAELGGFELARYPALVEWLERVAAEPGHVPIEA